MPETTVELVDLVAFLRQSSDVTVVELRHEIRAASDRLDFLLDHATLPCKLFNYAK